MRFVFAFLVYFRRFERIYFTPPDTCFARWLRDPTQPPSHTKTVRLIVEDGTEITGIVPNFRGKCFDITLKSTEAATRLTTSGFDYGAE